MDDYPANKYWPPSNEFLSDLTRIANATQENMWAVDNAPNIGKRATDEEKKKVWRDFLLCLKEDRLLEIVKKRHDNLGDASHKFKQIAQVKVKAKKATGGFPGSFFLTNVTRLTEQIKTDPKILGKGFRKHTSSAMKALYQDEANRADPEILDFRARIRIHLGECVEPSTTAVSAGQAAPASGGKRAEEGGAVGLKFACIEQRTPMVSTTADSTSQGAAVSDGKRAQEGGEMSPTTGVAPSQQQSDNPTGHTSSTKLQEEPECLEHWYHEKAVRLGQVCLKVKKPREFLTELEGLHDGEFSKELLKDAGIVDEVRSLEEAHNDPDIKSRAKAVRRKWRNELKRKWEEEGEKGGKKIPVRED